jgi:hypothetical protein
MQKPERTSADAVVPRMHTRNKNAGADADKKRMRECIFIFDLPG